MLGVTRPKLAIVERSLRQADYIPERGNGGIELLDRSGLEEVACSCYAIIGAELAFLQATSEPV